MRAAVTVNVLRAAAAGAVALVVAFARPGDRALVLDAYLLFVGALALIVLVRVAREALPADRRSGFDAALRPVRAAPVRPESLAALEREVLLSTETAFYFHSRIRPALREIAAHRLSTRLGIDLDGDPDEARALLGPAAWELVRSDLEPPADRLGRGRPLSELAASLDAIERI